MNSVDSVELAAAPEAAGGGGGGHRPMLFGLAYRLLGSVHDAEDVLQDAYLRWLRADRATVAEPRRFLSRVVGRLALDRLRARRATRETYVGPWLPEPVPTDPSPFGPLEQAERYETLSIAMLHLLERLSPPERAVYVLHTAFDLPYAEIAELLDRSPEDCRQLHHRAAEHVRLGRRRFTADRVTQQRLLTNFVAAAREGDLPALARLVAADATAWSDGGGRVKAALNPIVGTAKIVRFFAGIGARWREFESLEVNARPALLIRRPARPARGGLPSASTYLLTISAFRPTPETPSGQISDFFLIANPGKLEALGPLLRR